ncbi:MAG: RHS repeat protein [Cyanobacteria bacterium]|nr:RHS repeat protein [Cyanobacteriota bacterium]
MFEYRCPVFPIGFAQHVKLFSANNPRAIDLYDRGGNLRASIDQLDRVTHFVYDAVDRLIETIHPDAGETLDQFLTAIAPGASLATIDWTEIIYPDAPLAYLSDNDHIQTEYTQDGRVKASIDDRGTTLCDYDAVGNKTSVEDNTGRRVECRYDNLYRLVEETTTDPVEGTRTITELYSP